MKPAACDPTYLAKQVWLTSHQAAMYLGYTPEAGYAHPAQAFHNVVVRHGIRRHYSGHSLRFRRTDLDKHLRVDATPLAERTPA